MSVKSLFHFKNLAYQNPKTICKHESIEKKSRPYLELLVQGLDVVLDALDKLGLILADRATDVRTHKKRVEPKHRALNKSQKMH